MKLYKNLISKMLLSQMAGQFKNRFQVRRFI